MPPAPVAGPIVANQTIRVSSSQLRDPEISRLILKRNIKYLGKRPNISVQTGQTGFQKIRPCNCGIFPCIMEATHSLGPIKKCTNKPNIGTQLKIPRMPKADGPFKVTKEIKARGSKRGPNYINCL